MSLCSVSNVCVQRVTSYRQHAIQLEVAGDLTMYRKRKLTNSLSLVIFTLDTGLVQILWAERLYAVGVSDHADPLALKQQTQLRLLQYMERMQLLSLHLWAKCMAHLSDVVSVRPRK